MHTILCSVLHTILCSVLHAHYSVQCPPHYTVQRPPCTLFCAVSSTLFYAAYSTLYCACPLYMYYTVHVTIHVLGCACHYTCTIYCAYHCMYYTVHVTIHVLYTVHITACTILGRKYELLLTEKASWPDPTLLDGKVWTLHHTKKALLIIQLALFPRPCSTCHSQYEIHTEPKPGNGQGLTLLSSMMTFVPFSVGHLAISQFLGAWHHNNGKIGSKMSYMHV